MKKHACLALIAISAFAQPAKAAAAGIDPAAVAEAVKSVVVVLPRWRNVRPGFAPRSADGRIAPEGSGVAVLPGGYVATNDHVLGNAVSVQLRLADGRTVAAEIVGRHKATDIALLKAGVELPPAEPGPAPALWAYKMMRRRCVLPWCQVICYRRRKFLRSGLGVAFDVFVRRGGRERLGRRRDVAYVVAVGCES